MVATRTGKPAEAQWLPMAPAESTDGTPDDGTDSSVESTGGPGETGNGSVPDEPSLAELRERVEAEYDFDSFGPDDMAAMEPEEWEAAFDPETWITGTRLLDRLEADLRQRVADRDVFARIEREDDRLVAYSDESYAIVYPDGSVEGEGTVLRDVKPSVALCSMDTYDVPEPPEGDILPDPDDVTEGEGELGNVAIQALSVAQLVAALVLLGYGVFGGGAIAVIAGLGFLAIGLLLLVVVANARLSDAFRAEEYRRRLRTVKEPDGERPSFVPSADEQTTETDDNNGS